ncbi:asparaginase [Altericroceibacterium spongiae]|uniref:Asparaginase n=1 Tax=Altericroceibacterium spongiae TaxID=2320269 RepID=A0A420EN53_9SPHN|nr:asparaginase [Altericroceibacterium spongiae]RKF22034.1 asparaginase [Altericroceibacterium spongiae]
MSKKHIRILACGGTIAGRAASGNAYRAGELGIAQLLEDITRAGCDWPIETQIVSSAGSQDIGEKQWQALHEKALAALSDDDVIGLVITHGTDTAEETALLLDRTLTTPKPIVLVGAMRTSDTLGSDALRNLANSLRVATDDNAARRGVLVVMGDTIHTACDIRKTATQGINAFASYPRGPLGRVTPFSLDWFVVANRYETEPRHIFPTKLPRVEILYIYAGMDCQLIDTLLSTRPAGLVTAGLGQGNAPSAVLTALGKAVKAGIPVIRASRVDDGFVDRNVEVDDDFFGFVTARAFNPQKARIQLQLLLAEGYRDMSTLQAAFDRHD